MEQVGRNAAEARLSTLEAEIKHLRQEMAKTDKETLLNREVKRVEPALEAVKRYQAAESVDVLDPKFVLDDIQVREIVLNLSPEPHDRQMEEFLSLIESRGIKNALTVVAKMGNPHLVDDLHRFLVRLIKQYPERVKPDKRLARDLNMTLYQVALPPSNNNDPSGPKLTEWLQAMNQFLSGLVNYPLVIEMAVANVGSEAVFYLAVPDEATELLIKQLGGAFPGAKLTELADDYNIFNEAGVHVAATGSLKNHGALPLKTAPELITDPLNTILSALSRIKREGEGAAIQFVFSPISGDGKVKEFQQMLRELESGDSLKKVLKKPRTLGQELFAGIKEAIFPTGDKKNDPDKPKTVDAQAVEVLKLKVSSPIRQVNIRLIASGESRQSAEAVLRELESGFNQFERAGYNRLSFKMLTGRSLSSLLRQFTYREFEGATALPLNQDEITALCHFPGTHSVLPGNVRTAKAGQAPAPVDLPSTGSPLGVNIYRGEERPVYLTSGDRLRHLYTIGQTGTGKSTLLKNLIINDIRSGEGVCFIDPHGFDIEDVLASIPPERANDVIYFDPAETSRPFGLNMLEHDPRYPEQKTFVVNEMLSIFNKLFDMQTVGGPMFEQYFRNSVLLALDDPSAKRTLLDVSRVLAEKSFRAALLAKCTNPIIVQFWREVAERAGGEASLANMVPYITSKFDAFLTNDYLRPILTQKESSFNLRQVMDEKKILLVNLAKGRLGDINANLIGLILVGKILMAALSRVDQAGSDLPPFYLYIDEFQNVTTSSISTILSEARKYRLGLTVAHQFIAQLEEGIRDAVFGNVGSIVSFRVGADDAEYLEKQFAPVFTAADLMNLDNFEAYAKILSSGAVARPFSLRTKSSPKGEVKQVSEIKRASVERYGRLREQVEAELNANYRTQL